MCTGLHLNTIDSKEIGHSCRFSSPKANYQPFGEERFDMHAIASFA